MLGPSATSLMSRCCPARASSPFRGLYCLAAAGPPAAATAALPLVSSFLSFALFSSPPRGLISKMTSKCMPPCDAAGAATLGRSARPTGAAPVMGAEVTSGVRTPTAVNGREHGPATGGSVKRMSTTSSSSSGNPFAYTIRNLPGTNKKYYDLNALGDDRYKTLPFSIRVLLESAVRNCDGTHIREEDIQTILSWAEASKQQREIPFMPARVLLQDFTGVPAVVDLAAMRDAMKRLGGEPQQINPLVDVDLVIDHSVQVDYSRTPEALQQNLEAEMKRNAERFAFLKWGSKAFTNMLIVPPGSGIVHQVNLEYLARVVMQRKQSLPAAPAAAASEEALRSASSHLHREPTESDTPIRSSSRSSSRNSSGSGSGSASGSSSSSGKENDGEGRLQKEEGGELLYPDSLVGTDSHTTMINGLGVVGWGVGGIEAEAVMLGQQISMVLPQVIGFELKGEMPPHVTATDLVLTVTHMLRKKGVVGKFIEFYGPGVETLTLADRATVANMAPEYGATMGFFPVDAQTLHYLKATGRGAEKVALVEQYTRANGLFAGRTGATTDTFASSSSSSASSSCSSSSMSYSGGGGGGGSSTGLAHDSVVFSDTCSLDLSSLEPCVAGPKRPQDRVILSRVKSDFYTALKAPVGFKGYNVPEAEREKEVIMHYRDGKDYVLRHGSVVIAAITSCTNTSNPGVILGAGLLARNAVARGLTVAPYIVTTLSPGSRAVTQYLEKAGLLHDLEQLGFYTAGYGCMTCIGNTGDFDTELAAAINEGDLIAAAVLSGNRNFEGRVHPLTRANYLASPPLVVAYALAGRIDFDFEMQPLGRDSTTGKDVFLRDIWPTRQDVGKLEADVLSSTMFTKVYEHISRGTEEWKALQIPASTDLFAWDEKSTYIHNPPFFQTMNKEAEKVENIDGAYCLLNLGDSITTDHISPAGNIASNSPAAAYLRSRGVERKDFNTYGSRRGNDEVMVRGTFANIRLVNKMCPKDGPKTMHVPSGDILPVYDVAMRYMQERRPLLILAGKEYGSGSSRDWAAKGPYLMGVKAIIAESFERIHRTNLVGMGILPLQFLPGQNADSLGLTGKEQFDIELHEGNLVPGATMKVTTRDGKSFDVRSRIDTDLEVKYYSNGGILRYVLRSLIKK